MNAKRVTSFAKPALAFVVTWAVLTGLWILYTSETTLFELLAGMAAGLLAAAGSAVVWGEDFARFGPKLKWLMYFAVEPWFVLSQHTTCTAVLQGRSRPLPWCSFRYRGMAYGGGRNLGGGRVSF